MFTIKIKNWLIGIFCLKHWDIGRQKFFKLVSKNSKVFISVIYLITFPMKCVFIGLVVYLFVGEEYEWENNPMDGIINFYELTTAFQRMESIFFGEN